MPESDGNLYFAYGSNMSPRQMASRCPGALPLGPALLPGYRLAFDLPSRFWGGWVADVRPDPRGTVWGVLWRLRPEHWAILDDYEDVDERRYERVTLVVERPDGERCAAQLYRVVTPRGEGLPSRDYLDTLLEGAKAHGLPPAYVATLEALREEVLR